MNYTFNFNITYANFSKTISFEVPENRYLNPENLPEVKISNPEFAFECWSLDIRGIIPIDPLSVNATSNKEFYAIIYKTEKRFYSEEAVTICKNEDLYNLPKFKTIFYGASNFTRWKTLVQDMKNGFYPIDALNHGIGGATDIALIENLDRLILRYAPNQVIIQCSNNDVSRFTESELIEHKAILYDKIKKDLPKTKIGFVCYMPLPGQIKNWHESDKLQRLNKQMIEFCNEREDCFFSDVFRDIEAISKCHLLNIEPDCFGDFSHISDDGRKVFCNALKREIALENCKL